MSAMCSSLAAFASTASKGPRKVAAIGNVIDGHFNVQLITGNVQLMIWTYKSFVAKHSVQFDNS